MNYETELDRLYSNWASGYPPPLDEVMVAIGEFLGVS